MARQELSGGLARQEDCDTTFRTEISPQCTTVVETVCSNKTVTKTRPDIKEKCTTRVMIIIDQFYRIVNGLFALLD